jgi:hypothetical protein
MWNLIFLPFLLTSRPFPHTLLSPSCAYISWSPRVCSSRMSAIGDTVLTPSPEQIFFFIWVVLWVDHLLTVSGAGLFTEHIPRRVQWRNSLRPARIASAEDCEWKRTLNCRVARCGSPVPKFSSCQATWISGEFLWQGTSPSHLVALHATTALLQSLRFRLLQISIV